jgi:predicted dehydrogenase
MPGRGRAESIVGINVAVVGLQFGSLFVPVYRDHPGVDEVIVADLDAGLARTQLGNGANRVAADFDAILDDDSIDAVHIVTPPHLHGPMAIQALSAGKHCAAAIPAALEMGHLHELVAQQEASGKNYMMMETALYYPPAMEARQLLADGAFGTVTFGRGYHFQDMTGYHNPYFEGFPPHLNITHAIGPLLVLLEARTTTVRCLGSGRLPDEMTTRWGNPYPVETAIFELDRGDVAIEVSRSMSHMPHAYTEGFALWGDRLGYEWTSFAEDPIHYVWSPEDRHPAAVRRPAPDFSHLLPEGFRRHGGPTTAYWGAVGHLVHEFVSSIVDARRPVLDAVRAADLTGAGIAAHASAMAGGSVVEVPDFGNVA